MYGFEFFTFLITGKLNNVCFFTNKHFYRVFRNVDVQIRKINSTMNKNYLAFIITFLSHEFLEKKYL